MNSIDWDRVEEIFAAALARDAAARAAYLESACDGDPALRAEVEALLDAHLSAKEVSFKVEMPLEVVPLVSAIRPASIVGQKLDRFLVERYLGGGGMGEVYQARDTRLGRTVALKIASQHFSDRFEREAQAIAALNHPNICTLHDVGPNYLVMELVEGQTLADRIAKGPIPLLDALTIASQIADAMEAAHEKGIVHRDLKPANVKITPSGGVKVLDFGLAKVTPDAGFPTLHNPLATQRGFLLGTAAYMAPEQARGEPVDRRADIWAFGVTLYEMLTGTPAFQGKSTREVLEQITTSAPNLDSLPDGVRPVVARCLEKDPAKRWRSIMDVRFALETPPPAAARAVRPLRTPVLLMGVALLVGIAALLLVTRSKPAPPPRMRLSIDMGSDAITGAHVTAAISPDGSRLVFPTRTPDGKQRLSVKRMDQTGSVTLEGTEEGVDPFFSPDGKWIGFFASGQMKKVSVEGGAPVALCEAIAPRGASWGKDGYIVVALRGRGGLSLVPEGGGAPITLTELSDNDITHRWPQILPAGNAVLYTAHTSAAQYDDARVEALSRKTGKRTTLVTGAYFGRYLPSGHLLYVRQGVLMAAPFDPDRLEIRGAPVPLLDDVATDSSTAAAQFDFSPAGTFIYRSAKGPSAWTVDWLDSSGAMQPLIPAPGAYLSPKFSPDGVRLAFSVYSGKGPEIYSRDLARGTMTRITFGGQSSLGPVWTPDGKHIVFYFSVAGGYAIGWVRSDGAGEARTLFKSRNFIVPYSFSPDGLRLAYYEQDARTNRALWILTLDTGNGEYPRTGEPQPFLRTAFNELDPVFSRDCRWIMYASDESGRMEVYVRPFPGPGGKWQISSDGGEFSFWAPNGRDLFYETLDNRIMVVPFTARGDSFSVGKPVIWPASPILGLPYSNLDLHPDGKRFAVFSRHENSQQLHLTLLVNFLDEVARRAPRPR